jgi:hypothetical protein
MRERILKNGSVEACCPYGAWLMNDAFAINMALLTELAESVSDARLFYRNGMRFLKRY